MGAWNLLVEVVGFSITWESIDPATPFADTESDTGSWLKVRPMCTPPTSAHTHTHTHTHARARARAYTPIHYETSKFTHKHLIVYYISSGALYYLQSASSVRSRLQSINISLL